MRIHYSVSPFFKSWHIQQKNAEGLPWVQHREGNNPAIVWSNGDKEYYRWGNHLLTEYADVETDKNDTVKFP